MNVLEITDLQILSTDGTKVLQNLSLSIKRGERLGLIGESGSGKSISALAVMGLLPSSLIPNGSILVSDGEDVPFQVISGVESSLIKIRGGVVSIVFQEPITALDPLMRIGKQIAEPLRRYKNLSGVPLRDAVLTALEEVRINDPARIARAFPHEISGGERQRAAIAMALACEPALLIADEPTTALDVTVQADVLSLLDYLVTSRNMSLLFISHDLAVVSLITDRVIVLQNGETVESGSLRNILQQQSHPYTRDLVANARNLDEALELAVLKGNDDKK